MGRWAGRSSPLAAVLPEQSARRSIAKGWCQRPQKADNSSRWQDLGILHIPINDALNGNNACYLASPSPPAGFTW